ncbi:hypothetical protein [Bdellovibrio sp. KM01]|uniref:hypothetical protein n=1 Tax=Bdellovibrio sp. KM01 TaxID=2748865 RepID=UPI0015EAC8A7|nr:hypothetical protein [Bdellovibrio sp. KM01]QLY26576.1 hypothetical protein HW988_06045 [Bdellovibrio sp. KM01]
MNSTILILVFLLTSGNASQGKMTSGACNTHKDCVVPSWNFNCEQPDLVDEVDFETLLSLAKRPFKMCDRTVTAQNPIYTNEDYTGICINNSCRARLISPLPVPRKEIPSELIKVSSDRNGRLADYREDWYAGKGQELPNLPRAALQLACKYPDGNYFVSSMSYAEGVMTNTSIWTRKPGGSRIPTGVSFEYNKLFSKCPDHPAISKEKMIEMVRKNSTNKQAK